MRRWLMILLLPALLAGCVLERTWAPEKAVTRAAYRHDGPATLTLFTVRSNRSNEGAHSALMINAGQRVMFDPAGSFRHPAVPEQADLLYGITPGVLETYIDYHSRVTHHTIIQTVEVPPEVAARALRLARAHGAAPKAFCSISISGILRDLPGFDTVPRSFFPNRIMAGFGRLPGVRTRTVHQDDPADNRAVLEAAAERARADAERILAE